MSKDVTQYTTSAKRDHIVQFLNSSKEYSKIIYSFKARPNSTFIFNPLEDPLITDFFIENPEEFPILLKAAILNILSGLSITEKTITELKNNLKIQISDAREVKLQEWGPQHEGIPLATNCQVIGAFQEETYTKYAEAYCTECKHTVTDIADLNMWPVCNQKDCAHYRKPLKNNVRKFKTGSIRMIMIQEPLEEVKHGAPRILPCIIKDEDVFSTFVGQRKRLIGVFRSQPQKTKNTNKIMIHAIAVQELEEVETVWPTLEEISQFKKLVKQDNFQQILIDSFSPEIKYGGTELVKLCCVLSILGGNKTGRVRDFIHCLMIGDPGCVTGDTRIALGNGSLVRIDSLANTHLQKINIPIRTGKGTRHEAKAVTFHKHEKQPVIEIVTESGKKLTGTHNHPVLFFDGKQRWKALSDLKINDRIKTSLSIDTRVLKNPSLFFKPHNNHYGPKYKGTLPKRLDDSLASLFGYIIGDGWCTKKSIGFVVSDDEYDILPKLLQMMHDTFHVKPYIRKKKGVPHYYKGRLINSSKNLYYVDYSSKTLTSNLIFLKEKHIPSIIFQSSENIASAFLRWLFEADGTVFSRGRGKRAIQLKSVSPELLSDVQLLLLRFSIHSRIIGTNLVIRRGKDIQKFIKNIGFVSNKKTTKQKHLCKDAKKIARVRGKLYERVVKITRLKKPQTVYDIEIPNGHQFISNGIISHNTGKTKILEFVPMVIQKSAIAVGGTMSGSGVTVTMDTLPNRQKMPRAGIVPTCTGGVACLDELNQLEPEDRGKLFEAMESGKIHYNKAGFALTLIAETTILAGANPRGFIYDKTKTIVDNVNLEAPLISRFDFKINMQDTATDVEERKILDHMDMIQNIGIKQYLEKYNLLTSHQLTLFFNYAKSLEPKITPEAAKIINDFHITMRTMEQPKGAFKIDKRFPESMKRIAIAYAKMHLEEQVSKEMAMTVIDIFKRTLKTFGMNTDAGIVQLSMEDAVHSKKTAFVFTFREEQQSQEADFIVEEPLLERLVKNHPKYFKNIDAAESFFDQMHNEGLLTKRAGRYRLD